MKQVKRRVSLLLAVLMVFSMTVLNKTEQAYARDMDVSEIRKGDIVYFARYPQTKIGTVQPAWGAENVDWVEAYDYHTNLDTYYAIEPIAWRVLAIEGNELVLITENVIDAMGFHNVNYVNITWEESSSRQWLNSSAGGFFGSPFTQWERDTVLDTYVTNHDNNTEGTLGGNDTMDTVFLLSIHEATTATYG